MEDELGERDVQLRRWIVVRFFKMLDIGKKGVVFDEATFFETVLAPAFCRVVLPNLSSIACPSLIVCICHQCDGVVWLRGVSNFIKDLTAIATDSHFFF